MLVRRRDCDCLLLAWLAASGGLARHRLSDASAPSPLPLPSAVPLSPPPHLSHHFSSTTCPPSTFLTLHPTTRTPIYFSYSLFPSLQPFSHTISFVPSHSPPSVSLNHTYGLVRFTHSTINSSLLRLTFYLSLSLSLSRSSSNTQRLYVSSPSTIYRTTMHPR